MYKKKIKCEIYRDSMQNYKKYAIPPAQLIIADVPYNVGTNFYGSNPMWYNGGDNKNGKNIRGTGHMVFNWFNWEKDGKDIPKIHPAQKPVAVLKKLIEIFTDEGDVVIDPCCGSGSRLRAAAELGRSAYGFEIDRIFYERAKNEMLVFEKDSQMNINDFIDVD